MIYQDYEHLLGIPYLDGLNDCFGLARNFYRDLFGIVLPNYARPLGFDHLGMENLITDNFRTMGFEVINDYKFQVGDGLLFCLASKYVNHVGVYVGNGQFIHHVFDKPSVLDSLDTRWKNRLSLRVRHSDVTDKLLKQQSSENITLPTHLKGVNL